MTRITITESCADGTFYRYEIPDGDLRHLPLSVETDENARRYVPDELDGVSITWPIDQGYDVITNDPSITKENR